MRRRSAGVSRQTLYLFIFFGGTLAQVRKLKWNDLPRTTRDRLSKALAHKPADPKGDPTVDPDQPVLAQTVSNRGRIIGWTLLALFVLQWLYGTYSAGLGRLYYTAPQGMGFALYYSLLWFGLLFAVLAALYRYMLGQNLPYREGTYLFGLDVIEAQVDTLTITPLSMLGKIRVTEHYRNGAYQYTAYAMDFPGRSSVTFNVKKDQPDWIQLQLQSVRKRLVQAVESKNLEELKKADLLFDIRSADWQPQSDMGFLGDGPLTTPIVPWLAQRLQLAAAAGLILGLITWQVHDRQNDRRRFDSAIAANTSSALELYLNGGKRYRAEAETRLYPLLYAEAKKAGTVSAYRKMLHDHPQTPFAAKARDDIHQLIQASWEKFTARAGDSDAKMLAFMRRVVDFLEKKEDSALDVYFSPPLIQSLVAIDAELRKKGVAPVAAHFSPTASKPREQYIASALEKGFGEVFPSDILRLERITGTVPKEPTTPSIEIKYQVAPTDSVYQGKQSGRSFVGIRVNFLMMLRVPGDAEGFPMMLSVLPPQRFTVSFSSRRRYGTAPLPGEGPSDLAVYTAMAERAFDQFHDKLAQVFFGAAPVVDPSDAPPAPAAGSAAATAAADAGATKSHGKKKHRAH